MARLSLEKSLEREQVKNRLVSLQLDTKQRTNALAYLNKNVRRDRTLTRGWTIPGPPERDLHTMDRQSAMAQTRQKLEENPLVAGMFQTDIDNTISNGFRLSMRTKDAGLNKDVEQLWVDERDSIDVRQVLTWGGLQRMWESRRGADGDIGLNLMPDQEKQFGVVKSWVQSIEAERIFKYRNQAYDSGVSFNEYGVPLNYFVGARQKADKPIDQKYQAMISASRFILYMAQGHYRTERERGTSRFLPVLNHLEHIEEILDAMMQKVKNEAFMGLAFGLEQTPGSNIWGNGTDIQSQRTAEDGTKRQFVRMVPGLNLNLTPNEKVNVIEGKSPHADFIPFIRMMIRMTGLPFGMPLEMVLMDPSETNYSGLRSLLEFAKKRFRVAQAEASFVASRVFVWWLARQKKYNKLLIPASLGDRFTTHEWICPSWPYLDPLKEANAHALRLEMGVTSRHRIIHEEGEADYDDIFGELKTEQADRKAAGLIQEVSPASKFDKSLVTEEEPPNAGNKGKPE